VNIEVLIPTKGDLEGVLRVIREVKVAGGESLRIIVSVSNPSFWASFERSLIGQVGVELLSSPPEQISLYANFRKLVDHSKADWVSICADDDSKASDFFDIVNSHGASSINLIVPPVQLRRYDRNAAMFGEEILMECSRPLESLEPLQISKEVWPTWVFGIWRGPWIRREFPREDFDWLDCALVHRVIMEKAIAWASECQPMICGYDPSRPNWSVSGGPHEVQGWKAYCRSFLANQGSYQKVRWWWNVERGIVRTARRLNRVQKSKVSEL
jgi:hypothetical protein